MNKKYVNGLLCLGFINKVIHELYKYFSIEVDLIVSSDGECLRLLATNTCEELAIIEDDLTISIGTNKLSYDFEKINNKYKSIDDYVIDCVTLITGKIDYWQEEPVYPEMLLLVSHSNKMKLMAKRHNDYIKPKCGELVPAQFKTITNITVLKDGNTYSAEFDDNTIYYFQPLVKIPSLLGPGDQLAIDENGAITIQVKK